MIAKSIDSVIALHMAFWNRSLERPIVNLDLSLTSRFRHVPALPPQWADQDGLVLEPAMLVPDAFQPEPIAANQNNPAVGEVAFNTLFPYHRVPWPVGIMGAGLQVSTTAQTVWPIPYLDDRWYELANQGFAPCLAWLDKLLEFVQFIVERYYPDRCIPAQDMISRGPGDLCVNIMGPERFYYGFYDHPQELKLLLDQITDLYVHWARSQQELMPPVYDGYCNQYGIWSPGTCVRTQEDYAINLSPQIFKEFILPCHQKVVNEFDYSVIHTHSGFPQLSEWMLELDNLNAIEVALDCPIGPSVEELVPVWNRILAEKCLIILGPVTQRQLDMLVSQLSPCGLWLDVEVVEERDLESVREWTDTTDGPPDR